MKLSKLAIAAMLGLGLTTGLAAPSSARMADFSPLMSQVELARAVARAETISGVKLEEVRVWTSSNAAKYERFWQAFTYNYQECVRIGNCFANAVNLGEGAEGAAGGTGGDAGGGGGAGDGGDGDGDGGGGPD